MRKTYLLFVIMVLIPLVLLGCQSSVNSEDSSEISKVSVSNSTGFGEVNPDFFVDYEDEETIEVFQDMISNAVKEEGMVDIADSEFDVEVTYKDGSKQGYHLWVEEQGVESTLMEVEDTHVIFSIPEETTDLLIDLLK